MPIEKNITYKYKHPKYVKKVRESRRGPRRNRGYVAGWGHYRTAPVICGLIERYGLKSFAEIGCCGAQLCETVLIEFPDVKVTAVDITFKPNQNRTGKLTLAPIERLKEEYGERFNAIELPSIEAAKEFKDGELDLVYIDAGHLYEEVLEDLITYAPKVSDNGILAGHDYGQQSIYNQNRGVKKAVDEFFTDKEFYISDYFNFWIPKSQI
jgi:hypothetical protein